MVSARFQEYALKKYAEREDFYAPFGRRSKTGFPAVPAMRRSV